MINLTDFKPKASFWILLSFTFLSFLSFIVFTALKLWIAVGICLLLNIAGLGLIISILVSFFKIARIQNEIETNKTSSDNYTAFSLKDAHDILKYGAIESKDKGVVVLTNG